MSQLITAEAASISACTSIRRARFTEALYLFLLHFYLCGLFLKELHYLVLQTGGIYLHLLDGGLHGYSWCRPAKPVDGAIAEIEKSNDGASWFRRLNICCKSWSKTASANLPFNDVSRQLPYLASSSYCPLHPSHHNVVSGPDLFVIYSKVDIDSKSICVC